MGPKRELKFETLADIQAELNRLENVPVETHGTWSFYQILNHLVDAFEWAMGATNTFMPAELPEFKPKLGRKLFERMVRSGQMPPGIQNENSPQERVEGDAAAELIRLRQVIEKVQSFQGKWAFHPILGELSGDEWIIWCCLHSALHLGYADVAAE